MSFLGEILVEIKLPIVPENNAETTLPQLLPMGIKSRAPSLSEEDTFKIDDTKDTIENRTAEAGNQNVVFFNRVPKTGSEMFEHFTKLMSQLLGKFT